MRGVLLHLSPSALFAEVPCSRRSTRGRGLPDIRRSHRCSPAFEGAPARSETATRSDSRAQVARESWGTSVASRTCTGSSMDRTPKGDRPEGIGNILTPCVRNDDGAGRRPLFAWLHQQHVLPASAPRRTER